jgi:hypothetical protein
MSLPPAMLALLYCTTTPIVAGVSIPVMPCQKYFRAGVSNVANIERQIPVEAVA